MHLSIVALLPRKPFYSVDLMPPQTNESRIACFKQTTMYNAYNIKTFVNCLGIQLRKYVALFWRYMSFKLTDAQLLLRQILFL